MATITEDYCSKEIYKLLIQKGFDGEIHTTFDEEGYTQPSITPQTAMKWLREKDIHILFEITEIQKNPKYYCVIWNTSTVESYIIDLFDSYEEAVEAALKYSLENLI